MTKKIDFILKVLKLFSDYDVHDDLFWTFRDDDGPVTLMVNCNDLFWWACADLEEITPKNIDLLEKSFKDCMKISGMSVLYATDLFVARVRQMRPQGACYSKTFPEHKKLWVLLDECGPERKIEKGNPYKPGEYKS